MISRRSRISIFTNGLQVSATLGAMRSPTHKQQILNNEATSACTEDDDHASTLLLHQRQRLTGRRSEGLLRRRRTEATATSTGRAVRTLQNQSPRAQKPRMSVRFNGKKG